MIGLSMNTGKVEDASEIAGQDDKTLSQRVRNILLAQPMSSLRKLRFEPAVKEKTNESTGSGS